MNFLIYQIKLFIRAPKIFWYKFQFLIEKLFGIKRITYIKLSNEKIVIPNSIRVLAILDEVFIRNIYHRLFGCNVVLDLGAYIGESAIYLSKNNKSIIAYEVANDNFSLIQENCKKRPNITPIHRAVCGNPDIETITFEQDDDYSYNAGTEKGIKNIKKEYIVQTDFIGDVIKKYNPDGIKMDIEGAEWEILEYLIHSGELSIFNKGIIELHFRNNHDQKTYESFTEYLNLNKYKYVLFDNNGLSCNKNEISLINIYFEKIKN